MNDIKFNKELLEKVLQEDEKLVLTREESRKMTGYASIDKPWMKWHNVKDVDLSVPNMSFYDFFMDGINQYDGMKLLGLENLRSYDNQEISLEVDKASKRFINLGVKKGDVVSFMMLNVPEVVIMFLALNKIGAVANLIKFDESPARINYMLNLTKSKYFFISEVPFIVENVYKSSMMENSLENIVVVPVMDSVLNSDNQNNINLEKFMTYSDYKHNYSSDINVKFEDNSLSDTAVIVYTGGSTGDAKGVELTNKNLIAMALGMKYSNYGFTKGKSSLNILPPAIAYYINATCGLIFCGVRVMLVPNFEISKYPELVDKYKPNLIFSGPILLKAIEKCDINDFSYLTNPVSGGDKLYETEEVEINEALHRKGAQSVQQGYGASEETAIATCNPYGNTKVGSIGVPMANVTIGIFDYKTDQELQYGEKGEICITGDTVMKGYLNNPEATNATLYKHSDGKIWAHTDDLGVMDDEGYIFHKGRAKRMLTRQGGKLWLSDVEAEINALPVVEECCVVKLDDEIEREVPVVHIVLKECELSIEEMINQIDEYIREHCPAIYLPKYYIIKEELPYTATNRKLDFKTLEKENILDSNEFTLSGKIIKPKSYTKILK